MEVYIEVKTKGGRDPFNDKEGECFEAASNEAGETRAQIITYATAQLGSQFRTHIFSVVIFDRFARLIRWDRAGAIVTNAFPYVPSTPDRLSYLVEFFRRYDVSAPKERGVDESVSFDLEADEASRARKALNLGVGNPLAKFRVYDGENSKYFIGHRRPPKGYPSPTGRATRMFVVLDLERDEVMCLKDTWRINHEGMEKEGDIYRDLRRAGVPYIPDFIYGDDIPDHKTRTHELASSHVAERLRRHQH